MKRFIWTYRKPIKQFIETYYKCIALNSSSNNRKPISVYDYDVGGTFLLEYDATLGEYRGTFSEYGGVVVNGVAGLTYITDSGRFSNLNKSNVWVYYRNINDEGDYANCFADPSPDADASSADICAATWYWTGGAPVDSWFTFEVAENSGSDSIGVDSSFNVTGFQGEAANGTYLCVSYGDDGSIWKNTQSSIQFTEYFKNGGWQYSFWNPDRLDGLAEEAYWNNYELESTRITDFTKFNGGIWQYGAWGDNIIFNINSSEPATWSGYKVIWAEQIASSGQSLYIRTINNTVGIPPDSNFTHSDGETGKNRVFICEANPVCSLMFSEDNECWIITENSDEAAFLFVAENSGPNATLEELASDTWRAFAGNFGEVIITINTSSTAGWQETTELKENMQIKGFTPEIGRIYNEDTTKDATDYPTIIQFK